MELNHDEWIKFIIPFFKHIVFDLGLYFIPLTILVIVATSNAVNLTDGSLRVGDKILIKGHTTNFEQIIDSMQIEHKSVDKAEKGQSVGIKVKDRVRPNDVVYKIL